MAQHLHVHIQYPCKPTALTGSLDPPHPPTSVGTHHPPAAARLPTPAMPSAPCAAMCSPATGRTLPLQITLAQRAGLPCHPPTHLPPNRPWISHPLPLPPLTLSPLDPHVFPRPPLPARHLCHGTLFRYSPTQRTPDVHPCKNRLSYAKAFISC